MKFAETHPGCGGSGRIESPHPSCNTRCTGTLCCMWSSDVPRCNSSPQENQRLRLAVEGWRRLWNGACCATLQAGALCLCLSSCSGIFTGKNAFSEKQWKFLWANVLFLIFFLVLPYQLIRGTVSHLHLYQGRLKEYNFNLIALFQLLSVAVNDSETTACSSLEIWLKLHSYIIYHLFSLAWDLETKSVIMSLNQIKLSSLDLEQETVLNSCKMKNKAKN